jgi:hypothetical protein
MNPSNSNTLDLSTKRKFADLNTSNSSENSISPSNKPVCKLSKSSAPSDMALTKEDLVQLRNDLKADMKAELKEQLSQSLSPPLIKVSKLEQKVELLDKKSRGKVIFMELHQSVIRKTNVFYGLYALEELTKLYYYYYYYTKLFTAHNCNSSNYSAVN